MAIKDIIEDLKTHREGLLAQGFWALLVYRLSAPRKHVKSKIFRIPYFIVNRIMQKFIEVTCGIHLPESTAIGRRLNIEHFGGIIVHGHCVIGDDVTIRQGVTLGNKGAGNLAGAPRIGNRVDIGAGAKIIGNVTIGDDVRIGANAVVLTDIPSHSLAVGVPARVVSDVQNS
ncbi:serine O-acetyltransferase [Rhizobium giardinii]|jgi:serine O-acetyltransferase|uniref:serine O-acetyltransferase n=1 Tax=Rhizobium giardinii TaxID=56731 RepID=UPI003D6EF60A